VAIGQAYNFSSAGEITQQQLIDLLADELGQPRVTRHIRFRFAFWAGMFSEVIGRLIFLKRPPHITRYAVGLIGRPPLYSTGKARTELGWQPRIDVQEGLRRTLDWYRQQEVTNTPTRSASEDRPR